MHKAETILNMVNKALAELPYDRQPQRLYEPVKYVLSLGGKRIRPVLMLLTYSVGLGVPFVLSAVLIGYLKSAFDWIKRNYGVINTVCGCLLVLLGILMATGVLNRLLGLLS